MGDTEARLGDQRAGEYVIVVQALAIGLLDAGPLEGSIGVTARRTENGRLENHGTRETEPPAEAILSGNVVIHLVVDRIRGLGERERRIIIVSWRSRIEWLVWSGDQRQNGLR